MTTHTPAPAQQAVLTDDDLRNSSPFQWLSRRYTPEVAERMLREFEGIVLSKLRAPVAAVNIHRVKLKSRREMERTIPSERMGWWRDVSPGQQMVLRDATAADLARCILREGDTRGPEHFLCELEPDGALVSREAIEHCRTIAMPVAALASAPVAGEAQHDTDSVCAWQVWWNQHKSRYTTTRQASLAAFAAGKEWRGAAPQASEAVRDAAPASFDQKAREVVQSVVFYGDIQNRVQQAAQLQCAVVEAMQWAARAALSAQPGAQEGGSDA